MCFLLRPNSLTSPLCGHLLLDLGDRIAGVQTLGTCSCAVENGVATIQTHRVVEGVLALNFPLVTRVDQPPVGLEEDGRTQVLFCVPPVGGT